MRQKILSFFSSRTHVTGAERAAMMTHRPPFGTSLETAKLDLQHEIQARGEAAMREQLAKERIVLEEITAEIEQRRREGQALMMEKIIDRQAAGYEITAAIRHTSQQMTEKGLDFDARRELVQTHDYLLLRQVLLKDHSDLFETFELPTNRYSDKN